MALQRLSSYQTSNLTLLRATSFSSLPRDIRDQIYRVCLRRSPFLLLFIDPVDRKNTRYMIPNTRLSPVLLQVSHQTYSEGVMVLYLENVFALGISKYTAPDVIQHVLSTARMECLGMIENVALGGSAVSIFAQTLSEPQNLGKLGGIKNIVVIRIARNPRFIFMNIACPWEIFRADLKDILKWCPKVRCLRTLVRDRGYGFRRRIDGGDGVLRNLLEQIDISDGNGDKTEEQGGMLEADFWVKC